MAGKKKAKTKRKLAHPKLPMQGQLNLRQEGTHFDLRPIFDDLNRRYFRGRLRDYKVIWGRRRIERNFTPETFRQRIAEILLHSNYEETHPEKLAREVDLPPARDNALVPDQKERSDDALAV